METLIRGTLGRLLFSGDEVKKPVKVISGGEQGRMLFGKLMLQRGNVLIMDEPTNHLDMESIEALNSGLEKFPAPWSSSPTTGSSSRRARPGLRGQGRWNRGRLPGRLRGLPGQPGRPIVIGVFPGGHHPDQPHAVHIGLVVGRFDVFHRRCPRRRVDGEGRGVGKAQEETAGFRPSMAMVGLPPAWFAAGGCRSVPNGDAPGSPCLRSPQPKFSRRSRPSGCARQ